EGFLPVVGAEFSGPAALNRSRAGCGPPFEAADGHAIDGRSGCADAQRLSIFTGRESIGQPDGDDAVRVELVDAAARAKVREYAIEMTKLGFGRTGALPAVYQSVRVPGERFARTHPHEPCAPIRICIARCAA